MSKNLPPVGCKENLVIQEVENEVLIYDLKKNEAFCLNETSAFIWKLCDGKHTTTKISQELKKKFKTNVDEGLIWLALDQLKKSGLIETEPEVPTDFIGMSRRQVIRKVGLTSMVMLPIVASVISPTGAMAASCIPFNGTGCTSPGQCCVPGTTTCTAAPNRRCCLGPGNVTPGTTTGTPTLSPNNCSGPTAANRDTFCDNNFGANCCSTNAQVGTCTMNSPSPGNGTFNCVCF